MNPDMGIIAQSPIERRRLGDDVMHRLRDMIIGGQIFPGTRLTQVELASQLGVSRTPLREALRILEREGLVKVANGNRTVEVVSYTTAELHELYEVREVIDGLAARLLAERGLTPQVNDRLVAAVEMLDEATATLDREEHHRAHIEFHVAVVEECGNDRVRDMLPLVRMTAASLFRSWMSEEQIRSLPYAIEKARAQHAEIYEAIAAGAGQKAEKLARRHIELTRKSGLIEAATQFPPGDDRSIAAES